MGIAGFGGAVMSLQMLDFSIPMNEEARSYFSKAADISHLVRDRERFINTLAFFVSRVRSNDELLAEAGDSAQLVVAAKAVRSALTAVAKLTELTRARLGGAITRDFCFARIGAELAAEEKGAPLKFDYHTIRKAYGGPHWLDPTMDEDTENNLALILLEALDTAFDDVVGRATYDVEGKRGRPRGAKMQWPMHEFVLSLWRLCRHCGGRVTLSNTGGRASGSIVELLQALKPMLPKAFFPSILHYSFLRKVQKSLPAYPEV